jgi:hypothetical protein
MPDEHTFTLRQVDQARSGFAAIQDEPEFVRLQLAQLPTRKDLLRTAILTMDSWAGPDRDRFAIA